MLIDFSRECLRSTVKCSTVSNDGYEIANLTSDSNKGFLAYSCIKPPIHIDFTFICDVKINHVLIWPSVGAQKSSGFEISIPCNNDYVRAATGFLSSEDRGLLFYRRDTERNCFGAPANFLQRYMKLQNGQRMDKVKNLRISIVKTENSVPAVGRVEIWGSVSRFCDKKTIAHVRNLWQANVFPPARVEEIAPVEMAKNIQETLGNDEMEETMSVPDCFLDPITWSIMIQPIVLPSGAIIDQSTLEKHGKNEATWGRALSDPFTGIPFNDSRKPIIASALKARIDKYLLENKNNPEVMRLPRILGHREEVMSLRNRSLDLSEISVQTIGSRSNSEKIQKIGHPMRKLPLPPPKISLETKTHKLPVVPMYSKARVTKIASKSLKINYFAASALRKEIKVAKTDGIKDSHLDQSVKIALSNLQRFDSTTERTKSRKQCLKSCACSSNIFYKLPCDHIFCREVLTSIEDSQCPNCNAKFESRDPQRIHGCVLLE